MEHNLLSKPFETHINTLKNTDMDQLMGLLSNWARCGKYSGNMKPLFSFAQSKQNVKIAQNSVTYIFLLKIYVQNAHDATKLAF